jgi:uncharacterized damage-inducible protein DinB
MEISNLSSFYTWAEDRIIDLLTVLPQKHFEQKLKNTGVSLRDLTLHMIIQFEFFFYSSDKSSMNEIHKNLLKKTQEELLIHWKEGRERFFAALKKEDPYKLIRIPFYQKKTLSIKNEEYFFAYTDHHTYHRGQFITIFKSVTGKEAINTDFFTYLAEIQNNIGK